MMSEVITYLTLLIIIIYYKSVVNRQAYSKFVCVYAWILDNLPSMNT